MKYLTVCKQKLLFSLSDEEKQFIDELKSTVCDVENYATNHQKISAY